jgi:hypothetical protein
VKTPEGVSVTAEHVYRFSFDKSWFAYNPHVITAVPEIEVTGIVVRTYHDGDVDVTYVGHNLTSKGHRRKNAEEGIVFPLFMDVSARFTEFINSLVEMACQDSIAKQVTA